MIKANEVCLECGRTIELPDFDIRQPFYEYMPKRERALVKHYWQYHREGFPPRFKSLTQFVKWLRTPEGQALIHEAEREVWEEK